MKPEVLRVLENFYGKKGNIVWILDESWEMVWKNCAYDWKKSIPELLGVSEDCWDNTEKQIYWGKNFFDCEMICSEEDKYRTVILKEAKIPTLPFDDDAVIHAVHSMKALTDNFKDYLQSKNLHEQDDFLKAFEGNYYLVYRNSYIRRMLSSLRERHESRTLFEIDFEMCEIYEEAREILGDYAETEFIFQGKKDVFLIEDRKFFCAVVLSGIVLCCKEPDQRQNLKIILNCTSEQVTISIYMTALEEIRKDRQLQGSTQYYSNSSGEEILLNTFCVRHNGNWNIINKKENEKNSVCCKIVFSPDTTKDMTFNSPKFPVLGESFFDIYHVMLARICVEHDS